MYPMEIPVPSFTLLADGIRKSCEAVACDRDPGLPAGWPATNICSSSSCDVSSFALVGLPIFFVAIICAFGRWQCKYSCVFHLSPRIIGARRRAGDHARIKLVLLPTVRSISYLDIMSFSYFRKNCRLMHRLWHRNLYPYAGADAGLSGKAYPFQA